MRPGVIVGVKTLLSEILRLSIPYPTFVFLCFGFNILGTREK